MGLVFFIILGPIISVLPGWAAGFMLDRGARRIRTSAACWKCGYFRRGLAAGASCPECGSGEVRPRDCRAWVYAMWASPFALWLISLIALCVYLQGIYGHGDGGFTDALWGAIMVAGPSCVTILIWTWLLAASIDSKPLAACTIAACLGAGLALVWAMWLDVAAQSDEEMNLLLAPLVGPVAAMMSAFCVSVGVFVTGRSRQKAIESGAGSDA